MILNMSVTLNHCYASFWFMQLRFQEYDDFLIFNKPFGVRTHKVADGQLGFVEYVSEKLKKELWVVHRLDKDTSGLLMLATSKMAAAELAKLFETHEIKKTYLFLTDRKRSTDPFKITTHIEKQSEFFVNNDSLAANSETDFEYIGERGTNFLWRAQPKTGKPHQIRLHAQRAGIPIRGDNQHGGAIHHRLALHATTLEFNYKGQSFFIDLPAPAFESLLDDAYTARHELFQIPQHESYRLLHTEVAEVRADIFGDRLWIYDYTKDGLGASQRERIKTFSEAHQLVPIIRHMLNRGDGVGGLEQSTLEAHNNQNWTASEESVHYQLKTDSGFSPGLFLDQRENRLWVRAQAQNKKVLNLFSYTSGFSVNAALGGATEVTTVDVSKKFLDWSRENMALNQVDLNAQNTDRKPRFEFFAQDTILFLKGSVKRNRKWDLIICDPPSFGRSQDSVWKLEQNLPELAELLWQCLNKKGQILFTCNLEKRTLDEVKTLFTKKLKGQHYKILPMPQISLDYECTDELKNLMKGFILKTT